MNELLSIADKQGIYYEFANLPHNGSLSIRFDDGSCAFALDNHLECCLAEARVHTAHELGHCVTGSFYNLYSGLDVRGKHERRANEWAIRKLMPYAKFEAAARHGCNTPYDFAEWFGVTEEFAKRALELYQHSEF